MYIDFKLGLTYCANNECLYKSLIKRFLIKYKNFSDTIKNSTMDEIKNIIHTIKGITYNLGAKLLYDYSLKFEVDNKILGEYVNVFNNTYNELEKTIEE